MCVCHKNQFSIRLFVRFGKKKLKAYICIFGKYDPRKINHFSVQGWPQRLFVFVCLKTSIQHRSRFMVLQYKTKVQNSFASTKEQSITRRKAQERKRNIRNCLGSEINDIKNENTTNTTGKCSTVKYLSNVTFSNISLDYPSTRSDNSYRYTTSLKVDGNFAFGNA